jgi:hypothetical protein
MFLIFVFGVGTNTGVGLAALGALPVALVFS